MKTQEFYLNISRNLEILAERIKTGGRLNILDLNIHAETFYRDLLNIIYDWDLESANLDTSNVEAIDLIDKKNKIICQVTSTSTKQKIDNTLKKARMKEYSNLKFQVVFVFIADDARSLRNKNYENPYNCIFDSSTCIHDKVSILSRISQLEFDRYAAVNELFVKQFKPKPSFDQISNNLTKIVKLLNNEDLNIVSSPNNLHDFKIDEKIDINELTQIKETTIDEYKVYYNLLNNIYNTFDSEGRNNRLSVFRKVTSFYEKELLKDIRNMERFFNIIEEMKVYVLNSGNKVDLDEDILEMCIKIIVVDAFIRCKIFKNPKEYNHVIT